MATQNIRLSGAATLAILSLVVTGVSFGILCSGWSDGGSMMRQICSGIVAGGVLVLAAVIGLKAMITRDRTARTRMLIEVGTGIGVIVAAAALTWILWLIGTFSWGKYVLLVPSGVYIAGIAVVGKALTPPPPAPTPVARKKVRLR